MKRTLERSAFMLIGALIATIAYLLGNSDRAAEAQRYHAREDKAFDEVYCRRLSVRGEGTGSISLEVVNGKPILELITRNVKEGGRITLFADNNKAAIQLKVKSSPDTDGALLFSDLEKGSGLIIDGNVVLPLEELVEKMEELR